MSCGISPKDIDEMDNDEADLFLVFYNEKCKAEMGYGRKNSFGI